MTRPSACSAQRTDAEDLTTVADHELPDRGELRLSGDRRDDAQPAVLEAGERGLEHSQREPGVGFGDGQRRGRRGWPRVGVAGIAGGHPVAAGREDPGQGTLAEPAARRRVIVLPATRSLTLPVAGPPRAATFTVAVVRTP